MEEPEQKRFYHVQVDRTVTETRELIVYATSEEDAEDSADSFVNSHMCEDYIVSDSEWMTEDEYDQYEVCEVDVAEYGERVDEWKATVAERFPAEAGVKV